MLSAHHTIAGGAGDWQHVFVVPPGALQHTAHHHRHFVPKHNDQQLESVPFRRSGTQNRYRTATIYCSTRTISASPHPRHREDLSRESWKSHRLAKPFKFTALVSEELAVCKGVYGDIEVLGYG